MLLRHFIAYTFISAVHLNPFVSFAFENTQDSTAETLIIENPKSQRLSVCAPLEELYTVYM